MEIEGNFREKTKVETLGVFALLFLTVFGLRNFVFNINFSIFFFFQSKKWLKSMQHVGCWRQ